ncbi:energy-coupling factor transporter ATPase [Spiroplasma endosymbiont of Crioceris asparagi]|uniref:energy-coupling factor transporter ATPase n=1 Tax=Spiroplasma endosymbiont of Crioceris asparagi TaxID=3066286 RepID=UPI0030D10223
MAEEKIILNETDLNNFKILLNERNNKLYSRARRWTKTKAKFSKREATKDEVKLAEEKYKEAKVDFKAACDISQFEKFYNQEKQEFSKINKTDVNYDKLYANLVFAKNLLDGAKLAIKDKGKTAVLSKINNIALKCSNLSFSYRSDLPLVLKDVNFEINHGEYVAVIGHNGSGKSTLSKLIIGVIRPNDGEIYVFGNIVTSGSLPFIRKFLGIVFQNPDNQFIGSTVKDDIAFGLENRRVDPQLMPDIIYKSAQRVGMEEFLDHEPLMLSGGQKQRVAIASTLALSPDIIIFDEASSMLDPKGKKEVKEIMKDLRRSNEKTIISITHDMDEILNADKVIVMNGGELVRFGTPSEVLRDKEFIKSISLDVPFVTKVIDEFNKQGVNISHTTDIDEVVEELCQIN